MNISYFFDILSLRVCIIHVAVYFMCVAQLSRKELSSFPTVVIYHSRSRCSSFAMIAHTQHGEVALSDGSLRREEKKKVEYRRRAMMRDDAR